mmetsp:Transcript_155982/g.500149  ORF Transcript_155982/g.500149 Transcript_155982/m.500149 type:complete len:349 (-) Transcript_155982:1618-2664(-)
MEVNSFLPSRASAPNLSAMTLPNKSLASGSLKTLHRDVTVSFSPSSASRGKGTSFKAPMAMAAKRCKPPAIARSFWSMLANNVEASLIQVAAFSCDTCGVPTNSTRSAQLVPSPTCAMSSSSSSSPLLACACISIARPPAGACCDAGSNWPAAAFFPLSYGLLASVAPPSLVVLLLASPPAVSSRASATSTAARRCHGEPSAPAAAAPPATPARAPTSAAAPVSAYMVASALLSARAASMVPASSSSRKACATLAVHFAVKLSAPTPANRLTSARLDTGSGNTSTERFLRPGPQSRATKPAKITAPTTGTDMALPAKKMRSASVCAAKSNRSMGKPFIQKFSSPNNGL